MMSYYRQTTFKMVLSGLILTLFGMQSCQPVNEDYPAEAADPGYLHQTMKQLTDVIVHDIFSPPVASRIYAYSSIAAYEVLQQDYPEYQSLAGQLNEFEGVPPAEPSKEYSYPLAAVKAFITVGKALIFSEHMMDEHEAQMMEEFKATGMPNDVYRRSLAYGEEVGKAILDWSGTDHYKETRTYPKYSIVESDPARWQPTPPDYMDGIEPHWREIRTFVLEKPDQFKPKPPTPFDMTEGSPFYQEVMEVYNAVQEDAEDKEERIEIAKFWDCNPYVSHHVGHVMYATKKITPGGHWINIVQIACETADADIMKSSEAYAMTSLALADGFISCWDEKYRSNLIRPETVINEYIDESWAPTLQTPPFPEYTSGHSVISRAAAAALTSIFGDNFAFHDTSEEEYGLPSRDFESFYHASEEAALSRLYGGIHYRPAIDVGVQQGQQVGDYVVQNVNTRTQVSEAN